MPRHKNIKAKRQKLRTLCEVHREMYRALKTMDVSEDDPIIKDLDEAFKIGIKLVAKLRQYKYRFDNGWYEQNKTAGGELRGLHDDSIPEEDMQP